ncbi:DUF5984 family protein [Chthoniobacter flavus]|nr:DUF5984 family protein [Chthoniobacter flavus]
MALFEFDLDPVEEIVPWGSPNDPSLSWFVLTLGQFRMPIGDQVLFRYREEVLRLWESDVQRDAHYQIASIARDILGSVAPGVAPLPPFFELLATDRALLEQLLSVRLEDEAGRELSPDYYTAWRWLGERSPWTGYFVENPEFYFVRIGDRIHIRWDNRSKRVDGTEVWEASYGSYEIPIEAFTSECRDFSDRLLADMHKRISCIETGDFHPQVAVSIDSLREQQESWRCEFDSYFRAERQDIPWEEAESEIRKTAAVCGASLPA